MPIRRRPRILLGRSSRSSRRRQQVRVGRHDRLRARRARLLHVADVPQVRVLAAEARQVRAGPLRAPQVRRLVGALLDRRGRAVAHHLVLERPHLLAVAVVAALGDVDVAPGQFERRVRLQRRQRLDGAADQEDGRELDDRPDQDRDRRQNGEDERPAFDAAVQAVGLEKSGHDARGVPRLGGSEAGPEGARRGRAPGRWRRRRPDRGGGPRRPGRAGPWARGGWSGTGSPS